MVHLLASVFSATLLSGSNGIAVSSCSVLARADRDWAVKRERPSKKGVMQWTGTLFRNVACFRLRSGLAMWFVL